MIWIIHSSISRPFPIVRINATGGYAFVTSTDQHIDFPAFSSLPVASFTLNVPHIKVFWYSQTSCHILQLFFRQHTIQVFFLWSKPIFVILSRHSHCLSKNTVFFFCWHNRVNPVGNNRWKYDWGNHSDYFQWPVLLRIKVKSFYGKKIRPSLYSESGWRGADEPVN